MNRKSVLILCFSLAAAAVIAGSLLATRLWVLIPYRLPTLSMEPSVAKGSYFFVFQLAYRRPSDVRRGDIVAYRVEVFEKRDTYLKRVIALPGDRVSTQGERVFVNQVELQREPVSSETNKRVLRESNGGASYLIQFIPAPHSPRDVEVVVPEGCFFVMGDNRMHSLDSRYTGCVRFEDIIGEKL